MLSPPQKIIAEDNHRFKVVIAGRRFGKTYLACDRLAWHARIPHKLCWYVAPTYKQARMIAWRSLKERLLGLRWVSKINESLLTITLKNNSEIALKGADNEDSLRGIGLDFLICDEFADLHPEAFYEVLRPALSDREGSAMFIGTPKGQGNWAQDLYKLELEMPDVWRSFQFTTLDGGRVSQAEIDSARRDLDERTFRQEYLATFETASSRVYYNFDTTQNMIKSQDPDLKLDLLYVGIDFNIDPMSAVIGLIQGDRLYVIDEIQMFTSNTSELVAELKTRYPRSKIYAYPDPAGHARKTSSLAGQTDITILQQAGFVVKAPRNHTPVRDRINAVNSRLCNSLGERRVFVSPGCKNLIKGLERQSYKPGTNQPDKSTGLDHMTDALGYLIDYIWPIKSKELPEGILPERWLHR